MTEGMTQGEFAGNCAAAFRALGTSGGIFVSFGKYTRFPTAAARRRVCRKATWC
jgi:hypothetical protein